MEPKAQRRAIDKLQAVMSGGSNPRTPGSIDIFTRQSRMFLSQVSGTTPTADDAERWLASMRKKRKSKNYQNVAYWALKRLYSANKWTFPESEKSSPRPPEMYEQKQLPMRVEDIIALVKWAADKGSPEEAAMIAVATTYGLRRVEMQSIQPQDFRSDTLLIRTGKHGRVRGHLIPPEIFPILHDYDWSNRLSLTHLSILFDIVCYKAGIEKEMGENWHCLPPESLIFTKESGFKPINKVEIGEKVLAYDIRRDVVWSKVKDTFQHEYQGDLVKIHAHGILPFQVTPNHPFLVREKGYKIEKSSKIKEFYGKTTWKQADKIEVGDYLIVPKPISSDSEQLSIPFSQFIKRWTKVPHLKEGMPLNTKTARFFGFYVADGAHGKGGVELYFSVGSELISIYEDIIRNELYLKCRSRIVISSAILRGKEIHGSGTTLDFGGETLGRFLRYHFKRNAHDISIPAFIFNASPEIIKAFIIGYFDGDGYLRKERQTWEASTVCRSFAIQLQALLAKIGIFANVNNPPADKSRYKIVLNPMGTRSLLSDIEYHPSKGSPTLQTKTAFYVRVTKVDREYYDGLVYNLETHAKTYIMQNIITHNSIRRSLAGVLEPHIGMANLTNYMRWSSGKTSMAMRYVLASRQDREIDLQAFKAIPWLQYWKKGEEK